MQENGKDNIKKKSLLVINFTKILFQKLFFMLALFRRASFLTTLWCLWSLDLCLIARETTKDSWTWVCIKMWLYDESNSRNIIIITKIFFCAKQIRTHRDRVMQLMKQALYLQATTSKTCCCKNCLKLFWTFSKSAISAFESCH